MASVSVGFISPGEWIWDVRSLADLYAARRAIMRHSLNGYMPGSRDVLSWIDRQITQFDRRSGKIMWG